MNIPSSLIIETGQLNIKMKLISQRPVYSIEADAGHLVIFRWQGSKLAAGLAALSSEIEFLAENVALLESDGT